MLATQIALMNVSLNAAEFAINWLLQSTLLLAIGLTLGRLLRRRGSAVQSVVYRTTLVAVLIGPLATWGLSRAGVSGWSIELPQNGGQPTATKADLAVVAGKPLAVAAESTDRFRLERSDWMAESLPQSEPLASRASTPQALATPSVSPAEESVPANFSGLLGLVARIAVACWFFVALTLSTRLAFAWRQLAALRKRSTGADAATTQACQELATTLEVSPPEVLRSPCLPSPCLAGLRRPAVLLPEDDASLSIREVLVHELAHLKRHDCHWNLLRQVATALLPFQPLLWILSRRIEATAEEVCDDYVVHHGGDRGAYAHRLVDIAELSVAPLAAAGVGMVSFRSMLAQRVARIMDTSRPLSTRVGNLLLAAVLVGGLVGTMVTGLVGLAPRPSLAEEEKVVISDSGAADSITIRGTVVDPDGNRLAGAKVQIVRWYWDPDVPRLPLATVTSGADGKFEVTYRKSQFNIDVQRADMWKEVTIVASAGGYGPGWAGRKDLEPNEQPVLRLVRDDVPIIGQVIDERGIPLAGVKVKARQSVTSVDQNLDAWLDALRRGELIWQAGNRYLGEVLPGNSGGIAETVLTNAEGFFELKGVGRERWVHVVLEGPALAYSQVSIVTREMEPIVANSVILDPEWSKKHTVYGAHCQITVQPTQPIKGVVRDAATGEPLAGVAIESYRMTERGTSGQRQIRVASDEEGRFELVGMPQGPGKQIIAVPKDDQPYLMREFDVPEELESDQQGDEPIEMVLELHRGVWITGRVTVKETQEPVAARLHYLPYRTNPFAIALPEFDKHGNTDGYQARYVTDSEGNFRVVGLPGRAILGVEAVVKSFPKGSGHESIIGIDSQGHFPTYDNPITASRLWPTAMKEIDIAEGESETQLDFQLDAGLTVAVTVLDPEGREIGGLNVAGIKSREVHQVVDSATFDLIALAPGEERTLLFHQKEQHLGKAMRFVASSDAPQELTVKLEPCVTLRGQLVNEKSEPVSGVRLRISPRPGGDFHPELEAVATDAEGRFEHNGVLPGTTYDVMSESLQIGFKTLAENLTVHPGEIIDLGTIDLTSDNRPEPVRTPAAPVVKADRNQ